MNAIPFTKMAGLGNDFIIVDNRAGLLAAPDVAEFARRVCRRRVSLGGDELIIVEQATAGGDFSMRTINPDGGEVAMCANAARCVARYACQSGLAGAAMTIDTRGGPVQAWVEGQAVRLQLQVTAPAQLHRHLTAGGVDCTIHTIEISGVPHAVLSQEPAASGLGAAIDPVGAAGPSMDTPIDPVGAAEPSMDTPIDPVGAAIRHHPAFPQGTNVDFVQAIDRHRLWQRTYERGVEGETLACGSGATASSLVYALLGLVASPVAVSMPGGTLKVTFERQGETFGEVFLSGAARFIASGVLHPEAWSAEEV